MEKEQPRPPRRRRPGGELPSPPAARCHHARPADAGRCPRVPSRAAAIHHHHLSARRFAASLQGRAEAVRRRSGPGSPRSGFVPSRGVLALNQEFHSVLDTARPNAARSSEHKGNGTCPTASRRGTPPSSPVLSAGPRKGRGAVTNPPVRFETTAREPFDDGWGTLADLADLPPLPTTLPEGRRQERHGLERQPRHRLRPLDQPLPRLRAWLRLLLRPAHPRLSRPLAGPRFRDPAAIQAGPAGAAGEGAPQARLRPAAGGAGRQHRPLPAGGAHPAAHPRACWRCWSASAIR